MSTSASVHVVAEQAAENGALTSVADAAMTSSR